MQAILFDLGDTLIHEKVDDVETLDEMTLELRRHAASVIEQLAQKYSLAIVSDTETSSDAAVRKALQRLGVERFFDAVVTSVNVGVRKPDHAILVVALQRLGVDLITYAGTIEGLHAVLSNFADHLEPGGVCIIEPYIRPEEWVDGVLGVRTAERHELAVALVDRAVRKGRSVRREIGYAVATPDAVDLIREVHEFMLFTRTEYAGAFSRAGFDVAFDEQGFDPARGIYIGTLPARDERRTASP